MIPKKTPSQFFQKQAKGVIRYKDDSNTWIEKEYIDIRKNESGTKFYVLNEWTAQGTPSLVCQQIVEWVKPNRRRYRACKLHNYIEDNSRSMKVLIQAWIDCVLASDVRRALSEDGVTLTDLVVGSLKLYMRERNYLKQHRKKPSAFFNLLLYDVKPRKRRPTK